MTDIGFIGAGAMGSRIIGRLVGSGHRVLVSDPSAAAVATAVERGGVAAKDTAEIARCEIVVLSLPDSRIVETVLGDPADAESLAGQLRVGALVLDMGSSRPASTRRLANALRAKGVSLVDAPVSGGPQRAQEGTLTIMLGAESDADCARAEAILGVVGSAIRRTGGVGFAHAMKALNNLLSFTGLAAALEVLTIGAQSGLDPAVMLDVLNASTGRNQATEVKIRPNVLEGAWDVGFSLKLTVKDIDTALELAAEAGVDAPISARSVASGHLALDWFGQHGADQSQFAQYLAAMTGVDLGPTRQEKR